MKAEERARQMMHLVMEVFKIYALLTMILFLVVNISVLESARARYREKEAAGSHHYIKYVQHASCLHGRTGEKKTCDRLRELVCEITQRTPSPALTSG